MSPLFVGPVSSSNRDGNLPSLCLFLSLTLSVAVAAGDETASPTSDAAVKQLRRMLASYPDADRNGDGVLTEKEAGSYILRSFQKKRANRGPGIRNREQIEAYEARVFGKLKYRLLKPLKAEKERRYPLIVSLHGSGGIGDDNRSNLRFWNGVMARKEWREKYPCYVIAPQRKPGGIWGPKPDDPRVKDFYVRNDLRALFELIEALQTEFPIDDSKIYVLGASGGGIGTWNALRARPDLFAAAIPVCGRFTVQTEDVEKLKDIPIWCFHGDADQLIDVKYSRAAFDFLAKHDGLMKYTELRAVKHNSWIQAFTYTGDDAEKGHVTRHASERCDRASDVWRWLFTQRRE